MSWHLDESLVARYAAGTLDAARSASVEAHVIACADCRGLVARTADAPRLEDVWLNLRDVVDRPRRRPFEWLLVRLGMRQHVARLVAATPSLTGSWLFAVALTLGWSVVAAHAGVRGVLLFLVVAPLIPLAGVAVAYGPGVDPAYDVGLAAPMRSMKLLLIRSGTVFATTIALIGVAALGLPDVGWRAAAWLLPALGVTVTSLALSTWIDPAWAAGIVASAWVLITATSPALTRGAPALERITVFDPAGQAVCAGIAVVAALVFAVRSGHVDLRSEG